MLPTISIVTPSYNQAAFIEATIQSVLAQNYPHTEHLVVDGGSADGTLDILQKYERWLRWRSAPDRGQADAINQGFRQATGDIVAWLNSDDIYLPGALQAVARFFTQNPSVDLLYGDYCFIDDQGSTVLRRREIPFDFNILLYGLDYIGQPTVFFRRYLLARFGYLDESLHYGLDWEYWLRLASGGARFAYLPRYLAATRLHAAAKTITAPPRMHAEHRRIREAYWATRRFQSPRLHALHAALLNKIYRAKRQLLKLRLRRTLDFPPAHWVMYNRA
ncbi:MAG: glycosyltransferase family 2 protein [Anaerolineae bacterium]